MPNALKPAVCRLLVGLLLFTQLAIAAYACPALSPERLTGPERSASARADGMDAGCEQMAQRGQEDRDRDAGNPNLCAGHCHAGEQATDRTPATALSPLLLTGLYIVALPRDTSASTARSIASKFPPAASPPPHAILHCCFRI